MRAAALAPAHTGTPAPTRVVSLNPCVDTILIEIAAREQIAALSFRSRDPGQSVIVDIAKTYPITYETAEEVVVLRPDLILATKHSALATRNALKRVGLRVVMLDVPESIESSFAQIRKVADAIGRAQQGEALIVRLQAAIDGARGDSHMTAIIFQPTGLTPGKGTLISELMGVVGFENVAERYGIKRWGIVGLEQLIANPPAVLLSGDVEPGAPTRAEQLVQHPALRHMQGQMRRATFPARQLYCGGPVMELALRSLVSARDGAVKELALQSPASTRDGAVRERTSQLAQHTRARVHGLAQ
jgi:iron complex transport system substrate-binding protein